MNVRVVIADEREASFFDIANVSAQPEARGSLHNDGARSDCELETDRPGCRSVAPTAAGMHSTASAVPGALRRCAVSRELPAARSRLRYRRSLLRARRR